MPAGRKYVTVRYAVEIWPDQGTGHRALVRAYLSGLIFGQAQHGRIGSAPQPSTEDVRNGGAGTPAAPVSGVRPYGIRLDRDGSFPGLAEK